MRAVRKALVMIPAMMGVSLGGIVTSQAASAASYIVSDAPPPPPRIENVPHRDGYVWAPGHWESNGHSWAWVSGDYLSSAAMRSGFPMAGNKRERNGATFPVTGSAELSIDSLTTPEGSPQARRD